MATVDTLIQEFNGNEGLENHRLRFGVSFIRVAYAPLDFSLYAGYGTSEPIRHVRAGERIDLQLPNPVDELAIGWGIGAAVPGAVYAKAVLIISDSPLYSEGASEQSVGMAEYDSLGQIRGWHPLTSDQSIVERDGLLVTFTNTTLEVTLDPIDIPLPVGPISGDLPSEDERNTYTVDGRATALGPLSHVYAGAGVFQYLTIYHDANSTTRARIQAWDIALATSSAAINIAARLRRISSTTAPATGNPAFVPVGHIDDGSQPNSECVVLGLPTTQGSVTGNPKYSTDWRIGITPGAPAANPPLSLPWISLVPFPYNERGYKNLTLAAGVASGFALEIQVSAAATVDLFSRITFTEE